MDIPTRVGDVLILRTKKSFVVHAVRVVLKDRQRDFNGQSNVSVMTDDAAALMAAKTLLRGNRAAL